MIGIIKEYLEKRVQLVKVDLVIIFAKATSGIVNSLLLFMLGMIILLMFSFALALWIGKVLDELSLGFVIIGLFYLLLFVIYAFISKNKVELKIKDQIVKAVMSSGKL
ncbi:MAG: phage holin family protein [Flavobacteriales bacterium]|nr:phage holin family protein [Flavobacteriales bacterium]